MANAFIFPFDFKTTSTTVETTTYALAAGKHARITPIEYNADLVADGETLYPQMVFESERSESAGGTYTGFTVPEGMVLYGDVSIKCTAASSYTANVYDLQGSLVVVNEFGTTVTGTHTSSSTSYNNTVNIRNLKLYAGYYVSMNNASSGTTTLRWRFSPQTIISPPSFWVSGGASGITITGDKFNVELFTSTS